MSRPPLLALAASMVALTFAYFTALASPAARTTGEREQRDQVKALSMTVDWLGTYPADRWIGAELPEHCAKLADGRRECPIAITLRVWTGGELAPWRCDADVVLPAPRADGRARRGEAHCRQLDAIPPATRAAGY
jgi:hypothetical protein